MSFDIFNHFFFKCKIDHEELKFFNVFYVNSSEMHLVIRKKKFHVKILQYVEKEFVVIIIIIMLLY